MARTYILTRVELGSSTIHPRRLFLRAEFVAAQEIDTAERPLPSAM